MTVFPIELQALGPGLLRFNDGAEAIAHTDFTKISDEPGFSPCAPRDRADWRFPSTASRAHRRTCANGDRSSSENAGAKSNERAGPPLTTLALNDSNWFTRRLGFAARLPIVTSTSRPRIRSSNPACTHA
jgi:hypothetical protein